MRMLQKSFLSFYNIRFRVGLGIPLGLSVWCNRDAMIECLLFKKSDRSCNQLQERFFYCIPSGHCSGYWSNWFDAGYANRLLTVRENRSFFTGNFAKGTRDLKLELELPKNWFTHCSFKIRLLDPEREIWKQNYEKKVKHCLKLVKLSSFKWPPQSPLNCFKMFLKLSLNSFLKKTVF